MVPFHKTKAEGLNIMFRELGGNDLKELYHYIAFSIVHVELQKSPLEAMDKY